MTTNRTRVAIIIDVRNETLLTVAVWAHQSAHQLTSQLWQHGVIAHVARVEIDDISHHRGPLPNDENDIPVIGLDMDEAT